MTSNESQLNSSQNEIQFNEIDSDWSNDRDIELWIEANSKSTQMDSTLLTDLSDKSIQVNIEDEKAITHEKGIQAVKEVQDIGVQTSQQNAEQIKQCCTAFTQTDQLLESVQHKQIDQQLNQSNELSMKQNNEKEVNGIQSFKQITETVTESKQIAHEFAKPLSMTSSTCRSRTKAVVPKTIDYETGHKQMDDHNDENIGKNLTKKPINRKQRTTKKLFESNTIDKVKDDIQCETVIAKIDDIVFSPMIQLSPLKPSTPSPVFRKKTVKKSAKSVDESDGNLEKANQEKPRNRKTKTDSNAFNHKTSDEIIGKKDETNAEQVVSSSTPKTSTSRKKKSAKLMDNQKMSEQKSIEKEIKPTKQKSKKMKIETNISDIDSSVNSVKNNSKVFGSISPKIFKSRKPLQKRLNISDSDEDDEKDFTEKLTKNNIKGNAGKRYVSEEKSDIKVKKRKVEKKFVEPLPSASSSSSLASTSSRTRSSSAEKPVKIFSIISSGLESFQTKKLQNVMNELNAKYSTEWSDSVTHLVVGLIDDKKNLMCKRTVKYMKALLANKWIVSFDWIIQCSKHNRFVDETEFEIKGVKDALESCAPFTSRTTAMKIMNNCFVYFTKNFKFSTIDIKDLKEMVRIGGALVIESEKEFKLKAENHKGVKPLKLISISDNIGLPDTQNNIKYLSVKTFLDMISNFKKF